MTWLGAIEETPGSGWKWVTGEPFQFNAWMQGEPNREKGGRGDIGHPFMLNFYSDSTQTGWNDNSADPVLASKMAGFIVEWEPETPAPQPTTLGPVASSTLWIDAKGRTLQAKFVRIEGSNVVLDIAGKATPVALATLSAGSQQIARDLQAALTSSPAAAGATDQIDWLIGRWSRVVEGNAGKVDVHDFLPDHTVFLKGNDVFGMGAWSIKGTELLLSWPAGGLNYITLPTSGPANALDGYFNSRDGKTTTRFHMKKLGPMKTGLTIRESDFTGKPLTFWKLRGNPDFDSILVLLPDGGILGSKKGLEVRWKLQGGTLSITDSTGGETASFSKFHQLNGAWCMEGQAMQNTGLRRFLIDMTPPAMISEPTSGTATQNDWVPLFPNDSLAGWKGDVGSCSVKDGIMTAGVGDLISEKEYGSFHLKFDLRLSSGGNNGIGIWCADNKGPWPFIGHTGFEIQMIDDHSPSFAKATNPWQLHGALTYFIVPKAKPMGPVGSWNSHEIRMEGTKLTEIINGVTVIEQQLPTGSPIGGSRKHPLDLSRKRGHLVFLGMKGPADFRNVMIKELP